MIWPKRQRLSYKIPKIRYKGGKSADTDANNGRGKVMRNGGRGRGVQMLQPDKLQRPGEQGDEGRANERNAAGRRYG